MPPPDPTPHGDAVALFRYGCIADLLHLAPGDRSLHARLREKATREYAIPGTTRRRVAAETLRDWLYAYRRGGFDGAQAAPARRSGPGARPAPGRGRSALRAQRAAPRL
jgi:putative transposase